MSIDYIGLSEIMTKNVKVEEQNQNILGISKIMSDNDIGSVIIVDDLNTRNPIGIITERDIIRILGTLKPQTLQTPIKDLMSKPIIPLSLQATIADAIKLMHERKIRRIPIVDKNSSLVGIVTENDIFKVLVNNKNLLNSVIENTSYGADKSIYKELLNYLVDTSFIK